MGKGRYRGAEWATLGQMGYTGAEDEGIWAGMVGSDWEGEETVKEEFPPTPRPNHHPPYPQSPKQVTRKTGDGLLNPMTRRMEPPPPHHHQESPSPSPPPGHEGHPRLQEKAPRP